MIRPCGYVQAAFRLRAVIEGYSRARNPAAARWARQARLISTREYQQVADTCLDRIAESYENLMDEFPTLDVDVDQGVITVNMPPAGTYVINKQPANKQIWLASPLSGPKRYDLVENRWVNLRDESTLEEILKRETRATLDVDLDLDLSID